jgi:hypothetical protein
VKATKNVVVYGKANLTEKGKTIKKSTIFSVYGYDADQKVYAVGGGGFVSQDCTKALPQVAISGGLNSLMETEFRKYLKDNGSAAKLNMPSKGNPSVTIEASGLCMVKVRKFMDDKGWYYNLK